jgi:hypothetical protein
MVKKEVNICENLKMIVDNFSRNGKNITEDIDAGKNIILLERYQPDFIKEKKG